MSTLSLANFFQFEFLDFFNFFFKYFNFKVGPRHDRRFKFTSATIVHKLNKRFNDRNHWKKRDRYIHKNDIRKVKTMIPLHKNQKFKHCLLYTSPSPRD